MKVTFVPVSAVSLNFDFKPLGKAVHAGDANPMEAAGYLVRVGIKFAAGVQDGQNDRDGRFAFGRVHIDRNAAAIIDNA
jgi:hypothetical protein